MNYDLFINELMNELNQNFSNIQLQKRANTIYSTYETDGRNCMYKTYGHYL